MTECKPKVDVLSSTPNELTVDRRSLVETMYYLEDLEEENQRLREALYEHAIRRITTGGLREKTHYRCSLCMGTSKPDGKPFGHLPKYMPIEDVEHTEDCQLRGYEPKDGDEA